MIAYRLMTAATVGLLAHAAASDAATFAGKAVGSWTNLQATGTGNVDSITNADAGGIASFSFGVGAGTAPNLFTFNGVGSDGGPGFSANAEQAFDIGHFTYFNGTTTNFPQLSSIDLGIMLTLTSPLANTSNFLYDFGIDLTPNTTGNPVLDGDIVTISNGLTNVTFTSGSTVYTLMLVGFSTNGGATYTSQFLSPEDSTATADIYATITSHVLPVPEPRGAALLALGIAGLIASARARRRTAGSVGETA